MAKFKAGVTTQDFRDVFSAYLGVDTTNKLTDKDVGKAVKLSADSRYVICSAGDPIEGFVEAVESSTVDGYSFGSVRPNGHKTVICNGLQATAGTGAIAIGDYVVAGEAVAVNTASTKTSGEYTPKVCKATMQPGVTEAGAVGDVNDMLKVAMFGWRVVAFVSGTGAVGDVAVIKRV